MTELHELMSAALIAPPEKLREAAAVLRGDVVGGEHLTLKEVGTKLGISHHTLWRWGIQEISHTYTSGNPLYRLREVEEWLRAKESTVSATNAAS